MSEQFPGPVVESVGQVSENIGGIEFVIDNNNEEVKKGLSLLSPSVIMQNEDVLKGYSKLKLVEYNNRERDTDDEYSRAHDEAWTLEADDGKKIYIEHNTGIPKNY